MKKLLLILLCMPLMFSCGGDTENLSREITYDMLHYDNYTGKGLIDTFRLIHPETPEQYTWWSYRGGARAKNVGWRIDYFLVSDSLKSSIKDAFILSDYMGSDHCPIGIDI